MSTEHPKIPPVYDPTAIRCFDRRAPLTGRKKPPFAVSDLDIRTTCGCYCPCSARLTDQCAAPMGVCDGCFQSCCDNGALLIEEFRAEPSGMLFWRVRRSPDQTVATFSHLKDAEKFLALAEEGIRNVKKILTLTSVGDFWATKFLPSRGQGGSHVKS